MQALHFEKTGTLDALALRDVAMPVLHDGDVLVKIHASGINPSDIKNVLGRFPYTTLPRIPGRDFSGVVIEGPSEWQGKAVWGSGKGIGFTRDGSHAEYLAFPVAGLSLKPEALSFTEAAAVGVPYITAMEALDRSGVKKNTRLLIIGAAGAVGSAAIALARQRGAQLLAAVRKPAQQASLQAQGIDSILLTDEASLASSVQKYFPDGADAVFDTTGFWLSAAVGTITLYGAIAVIAAPVAKIAEFPLLDFYRRGSNLVGVNSLLHDLPTSAKMLDQLRAMFDAGMAAPGHVREYALSTGLQVYREVDAGSNGKPVFVMNT
ncbi:MAG TPA: zinc-binding alcohol dehydrogenase family protein [Pseudomonadales bacterium]|nr:zinc-binding alcohol dehydrogenase family protein [Pseudomonadales bacterium]